MEAATAPKGAEETDADREAIERANATPDTDAPLPGEGEGEQPEDEAVIVSGTDPQLTLAIGGGGKPQESTVTLAGGEFKMRGQFKKGDRVTFVVEGTIDEVAIRDNRDRKLNVVTSTKRKHVLSVERIDTMPNGVPEG